jgi:RNA polymerase sigma-70 factor (ECF subfamily)
MQVAMSEPIHLVSEEVPQALGADRTSAFEGLVNAQYDKLYGGLCLITRDRVEAEDVLQEAFLRVWERWDRVVEMDDPAGYLFRTAMNLWRKRRRRVALAVRRAMRLAPPRDELAEVEAREIVVRALAALTERQRAAIVLVDLLDHTSEEAAKLLGVQAPTVRVLVSKGRAALKRNAGETDD